MTSSEWNKEDSQGGRALRKSEKAPGGGGGVEINKGVVGAMICQPCGMDLIETGTAAEGTWGVFVYVGE
jgi:hypothetical protein